MFGGSVSGRQGHIHACIDRSTNSASPSRPNMSAGDLGGPCRATTCISRRRGIPAGRAVR